MKDYKALYLKQKDLIEQLNKAIIFSNHDHDGIIARVKIRGIESELAAFEKEGEQEEQHETCDGCSFLKDNGCMLDVSVSPDCWEHDKWTSKPVIEKGEEKLDINIMRNIFIDGFKSHHSGVFIKEALKWFDKYYERK